MTQRLQESEVIGFVIKARVQLFFIIIGTEAALAIISVVALIMSIYTRRDIKPEVLIALSSIASGLLGSLATILTAAIQTAGRVTFKEGKIAIEPINSGVPSGTDKSEDIGGPSL